MRKKLQTKTTKCWHASFTVRSNSGESWCVCVCARVWEVAALRKCTTCFQQRSFQLTQLHHGKSTSKSKSKRSRASQRTRKLRRCSAFPIQIGWWFKVDGFLENKAGPNSHANGFLKNTKLKTKGRPKGRFALLHKLYLCGKGFCMFILTRICHCTQI